MGTGISGPLTPHHFRALTIPKTKRQSLFWNHAIT